MVVVGGGVGAKGRTRVAGGDRSSVYVRGMKKRHKHTAQSARGANGTKDIMCTCFPQSRNSRCHGLQPALPRLACCELRDLHRKPSTSSPGTPRTCCACWRASPRAEPPRLRSGRGVRVMAGRAPRRCNGLGRAARALPTVQQGVQRARDDEDAAHGDEQVEVKVPRLLDGEVDRRVACRQSRARRMCQRCGWRRARARAGAAPAAWAKQGIVEL